MGWTKYGLTAFLLVVQLVVGAVGAKAGYTVSGVPYGVSVASDAPGILGIIEWIWDSIGFMFHMMTFQVDGAEEFGVVFIFMALMSGYLVINLIRGG